MTNKAKKETNASRAIFFIMLSVIWPAGCVSLFIPAVRLFVLSFGELLLRRPFNYPEAWNGSIISLAVFGIICYCLFVCVKLLMKEKACAIVVFAAASFMVFLIISP